MKATKAFPKKIRKVFFVPFRVKNLSASVIFASVKQNMSAAAPRNAGSAATTTASARSRIAVRSNGVAGAADGLKGLSIRETSARSGSAGRQRPKTSGKKIKEHQIFKDKR